MITQSEPGDGRLDPSLSASMSERRQLINLAYRLCGSLADAEDVAQETYARWYAMSWQQQEAIESRVVLESMAPAQRVAFILHDVFRYSFDEVAEIVGRTPAACVLRRRRAATRVLRTTGTPVRNPTSLPARTSHWVAT
jgi:DNA-directed RNA polymerase specialized sigma24 family protein